MKKFMFVNRKAPYGTIYALESLEVVLITATFDQDVSLGFLDDGVYELSRARGRRASASRTSRSRTARSMATTSRNSTSSANRSMRGLTEADLLVPVEVLDRRRDGRPDGRAGRRAFLLKSPCCTSSINRRADRTLRQLPAPVAGRSGAAADRGRRVRRHVAQSGLPAAVREALKRLEDLRAATRPRGQGHAHRPRARRRDAGRLRRLRRPRGRTLHFPFVAVGPNPSSTDPEPGEPHEQL